MSKIEQLKAEMDLEPALMIGLEHVFDYFPCLYMEVKLASNNIYVLVFTIHR